jgi:hypothetical protein
VLDTFVQTALLEAAEDLVIDTAATTEYFSTGSHALNSGGVEKPSMVSKIDLPLTVLILIVNTVLGSVIECQLVSSNKWLLQVPNPNSSWYWLCSYICFLCILLYSLNKLVSKINLN